MIKAVFFDIDDTLYSFTRLHREGMRRVFDYAKGELGIDKAMLQRALEQAMKEIADYTALDSPVTHNRQIRFQNALTLLKKPIYPHGSRMYELYWDSILEGATPEPGLIKLLEGLKKKGIYLGIGTDMTSWIQNKKLEKLGIAVYFDAVVTCEEAGADKPSKRFFELCVKKAGCRPEECLFIGDSLKKDVLGPRKIGMNSACYNRYSKVTREEAGCVIEDYQTYLTEVLHKIP